MLEPQLTILIGLSATTLGSSVNYPDIFNFAFRVSQPKFGIPSAPEISADTTRPVLLSHRAGLDLETADLHDFLILKGIGPDLLSELSIHLQSKEYDRRRSAIYLAKLEALENGWGHVVKQPGFGKLIPPFNDPDAQVPLCPSASYIEKEILRRTEAARPELDQAVAILPQTIVATDDSFKVRVIG